MQRFSNSVSLTNYHIVNTALHQTDTREATLKRLHVGKSTRQQQMVLLFAIMHDARPLHADKGNTGGKDHLEVTSHTYEEKQPAEPARRGTNFSPGTLG